MAGALRHSVLVRFLRTFALLILAAAACSAESAAERIFKEGERAEKQGDLFHALLLFSQAAALEPANAQFAAHKAALESKAPMLERAKVDDRAEVYVEPNAPGDPFYQPLRKLHHRSDGAGNVAVEAWRNSAVGQRHQLLEAADRAMQVHGAIGYSRHKPFEHIFRHHRRYRITEGSEEIQMRRVAQILFGITSSRKS